MSKSQHAQAVLLHWAHLSMLIHAATEVSDAERLTHTFTHMHMQAIVTLAIKSKAGPIMIPFRERIALSRWMMAHHMVQGGVGASGEMEEKENWLKEMERGVRDVRRGVKKEQVMNDDGAYVSWLTNQNGLKKKVLFECRLSITM